MSSISKAIRAVSELYHSSCDDIYHSIAKEQLDVNVR